MVLLPVLIGSFFVLKVITLLSLPVFGVMIYETWHPCYSGDTQPPGLSCRIFGAYLPFSINRINLHILSAQRCALFSSPKLSYSASRSFRREFKTIYHVPYWIRTIAERMPVDAG